MLARRPYGWLGTFQAMASPCEVHLATHDKAIAVSALLAVTHEAQRIEAKFSRYRADSTLSEINARAGEPTPVDQETARLLDYATSLFELSDGKFDISSGALRRVWKFDGSDRVPNSKDVKNCLQTVGWQRVHWKSPVIQLEPGMEIDLGGIGKEYAVDRSASIAQQYVTHCMINFGGDLTVTGTAISTTGWTIGIEDPVDKPSIPTQIKLSRGALATSGDAHRFLVKNGKRYGHILDPTTGWPVENAPRSVTVTAPTCTNAGMLATLAMLHGSDAESFLETEAERFWCLR